MTLRRDAFPASPVNARLSRAPRLRISFAMLSLSRRLKKSYDDRSKWAQKTRTSSLYKLIQNAISGCISDMRCLSEAERKQLQEDTIKSQEQVEILQVNLDKINYEKEELATKLKQSEAQRERDKAEMEAQRERDKAELEVQRERDKAEMEDKMNKLFKHFTGQSSLATESAVETEQTSKLHFFKP